MELIHSIARIVQLLWLVLLTALLGNVIANNINGPMAAINFSLFTVVLAWLACLWGLAAAVISALTAGSLGFVALALDGLATLFTLIAAIVLPAKLRAVNCGGDNSIANRPGGWIGFGSADTEKRCRELQASSAFLWFLFATLAATLALTALGNRRRYGGSAGGSTAPHMSQVRV